MVLQTAKMPKYGLVGFRWLDRGNGDSSEIYLAEDEARTQGGYRVDEANRDYVAEYCTCEPCREEV